jgi:predicted site-specific integrase-resolvase
MMRPRPYALRVGLPYRTLYEYLYTGVIPYYKLRGVLLIDIKEADAIIRSGLQKVDRSLTKAEKAKIEKGKVAKQEKVG